MRPSFLGLVLSGFLILVALIVLLTMNGKINKEHAVMIALLFAVAISAHSLQHSMEEIFFGFNPMVGKWMPADIPEVGTGAKCDCPCRRMMMAGSV